MKTTVSLLTAATLTAFATPAFAANPQSVDIVGTAEAFCTLPSEWQPVTSTNNVSLSQFSGRTWTIPGNLLADNQGNGIVSNTEVAIRIRGQGICNTPHTITVTSTNGGLVQSSSVGTPAPAGFQNKRKMIYNANWKDTPNGIFNWIPQSPGASTDYVYNVAPPGVHDFDVRFGLVRDGTAGPMVAGTYTDQLVVTISIAS